MNIKTNKIKAFILSLAVFVIGFTTVSAWTGPTANPPASNTAEPINAGSNPQTKAGVFRSETSVRTPIYYDYPGTDYYLDLNGTSFLQKLYVGDGLAVGSSKDDNSSDLWLADKMYDWDNTNYYVDPAETSKFKTIDLGGVPRSSWPSTGVWLENGSNIYYNSGNVGIGTTSPLDNLHIVAASGEGNITPAAQSVALFQRNASSNYHSYITIGAGTKANAGIHFGDKNNSRIGRILYNNTDNEFRFITNASQQMVIDNNGNVGIGTTNPSRKLDVSGDARVTGNLSGVNYIYGDYGTIARSTDEWLRLNDGGSHTNGVYIPNRLRADGGLYVGDDEYFYRNSEDFIRTGDHLQSDASVRAPIFYDSNDTRYYINPASTSKFKAINLGGVTRSSWPEGSSSPWSVSGSSVVYSTNGVTAQIGYGIASIDGGSYSGYKATYGSGNQSLLGVTTDGLAGASFMYSNRAFNIFKNYSNAYFRVYHGENFVFDDLSGTRMKITSSGVYAPIFYDINSPGNYVNPASTSQMNIIQANRVYRSYGYNGIEYDANNTTYYVDPSYASYFKKIYYDSAAQASDIRLKKNVQDLGSSLDKILQMRGVTFEWKDSKRGDGVEIGLIAQELEKIYPELVETEKETGFKSIQYVNLVVPLIEAVKEQQQEIDELKALIQEIKE